jgi:hypothetical protein
MMMLIGVDMMDDVTIVNNYSSRILDCRVIVVARYLIQMSMSV